MSNKSVIFISNEAADHASEELWSRTAVDLTKQGFSVSASVPGWSPLHWRVQKLKSAGVHVHSRPTQYPLWKRGWHYIFSRGKATMALEVEKLLRTEPPKLVVLSPGFFFPPIELIELCVSMNLPFVTVANGNHEHLWPSDSFAERYRNAFASARRCYFVSKANLRLAEKQIGCELLNAEVVWSQYNVDFNSSPAWPISKLGGELRLACVGRLFPPHKGQDILLEVLASPAWTNRPWHLSLYGEGPMRNSLERLTTRLGLSNRVTFAGHLSVEEIWSVNQVLVLPSRCEGLPLAMVEAMLCGRPVLATDVGGNSEVIIDGVTGFLAGAATVPILAQALERLWANRNNLENMGRAGAKKIRELVPSDPIRVFSERIKSLM
jgi:glycosyltransferase involved in cell wall biosynthesis